MSSILSATKNDKEYGACIFPLCSETCMLSVQCPSLGFVLRTSVFLVTEGLRESGPINGWRGRRRLVCPDPGFDLAPDQHD